MFYGFGLKGSGIRATSSEFAASVKYPGKTQEKNSVLEQYTL